MGKGGAGCVAIQPPARYSLPAVAEIEPLEQGYFDNLCGLYALINALRLALQPVRPLSERETQILFNRGIRFLDEQGRLSGCLTRGMNTGLWHRLAEQLVIKAGAVSGRTITIEKPFRGKNAVTRSRGVAELERIVASDGVVLLLVLGAYRHYTVISGYTPRRLLFFDSYGYDRVVKSDCVVGSRRSSAPHLLRLRSALIIDADAH